MSSKAWFPDGQGGLVRRNDNPGEPGPGQVLISVAAAGVNRPDLLQRQGLYPPPPGASEALGLEIAGTVVKCGEDAGRFRPGDAVMALLPGGGYADLAIADEGCVMPLPAPLTMAEAAALPETAFTVWANVFDAGKLSKGERLFVHGATSGIGTMAAGIASAMGHDVYGTAGTATKVAAAEKLGFTKVWNYKDTDWSTAMKDAGGVDVVLDMVGGSYLQRNLDMLRPGGRHLSIAFLGGMEASFRIMDVMRKGLILTGSTLRARSADEKGRLRAAVEASLFPLISTGKLKPEIGLELPMERADEAHQAMASGRLMGKAVLLNG